MRSNVVSEASLSTRVSQWWLAVPFITATVMISCAAIYAISLLVGYDSFEQVCFLPYKITSKFQVYRIYTSSLFHVSILHLVFNMLALVPIGSGIERILGSIRYAHVLFLIATCNGVLHLLVALIAAYNPFHRYDYFIKECSIGFSGMIFAMIVMETSLSGAQNRSIFGLFNVPAKWYAWILLILFQILIPNVSLLGHLCGILSGFAYSYGLLNPLLFGSSTYASIESSSVLAYCVRRQGFIIGGGMPTGTLPTISHVSSSTGLGSLWRALRSWMPQRVIPIDERFPGRGRTLATGVTAANRPTAGTDSRSSLQVNLLESHIVHEADTEVLPVRREVPAGPDSRSTSPIQSGFPSQLTFTTINQHDDEVVLSLVAMGFERDKAEVALDAAKGDVAMAVEILSSQAS